MTKKLTASDAIKAAQSRSRLTEVSAEGLAELRKLCAYNDEQISRDKRVGSHTAIKILNTFGWSGHSPRSLNQLCEKALGRRSYATP